MTGLEKYISSKKSSFNNRRMFTLLTEFILVERWASVKSFNLLFNNAYRETTRRFLERMCDFDILSKEVMYLNGSIKPCVVYLMTKHGFAYLSPDGIDHNISVVNRSAINSNTLLHSIELQSLHAVCLVKGYSGWTKPDYMLKKKGVHLSDALASKDGLKVAFELERTLKTPSRYDNLFEYYVNELFESRLNKVYYVCPDMKTANKIENYFRSIKKVMCDDKSLNTTDALYVHFEFVDYRFFGFDI